MHGLVQCSQSHNRIHIFHRLPNMNRLHLPSSTTTPCFYPFLFLSPFTSFQLRWAHQLTMLQVWESLLVSLPWAFLVLAPCFAAVGLIVAVTDCSTPVRPSTHVRLARGAAAKGGFHALPEPHVSVQVGNSFCSTPRAISRLASWIKPAWPGRVFLLGKL